MTPAPLSTSNDPDRDEPRPMIDTTVPAPGRQFWIRPGGTVTDVATRAPDGPGPGRHRRGGTVRARP